MKRAQGEDIEREMQELKATLEVATGEYGEEDYAKLCAMVHTLNAVKRELLKKRPSMKRVEQLVRDVNRTELKQITAKLKARTAKSRWAADRFVDSISTSTSYARSSSRRVIGRYVTRRRQ